MNRRDAETQSGITSLSELNERNFVITSDAVVVNEARLVIRCAIKVLQRRGDLPALRAGRETLRFLNSASPRLGGERLP